jgi:hypothetical protein
MTRIVLFLIASRCFGMFGVLIPSATYYVDSVYGSDSNNGTSAATAYQTIAKVMAQTLNSSTIIALGSRIPNTTVSWREQINTSQAGLTVIGYGSTQPLLDASSTISAGAWTKTGGYTNIYQATVTVSTINGWFRVWEDNTGLNRAASLSALDSAVGYIPSGDPTISGGSFTLYVHATGNGNPASNGKTYDYNARSYGLAITASGAKIINVRTRRNLHNDGSLVCNSNCTLIDTLSEEGTKHNVFVGEGSYVYRSVAHNAYYAGQSAEMFVYYENAPTGKDVTFNATNAYCDTLQNGELIGAYFGHAGGGSYGTITYQSASASNVNEGFNGTYANLVQVINGTVTGSNYPLAVYNPTVYVSGGSFTGCLVRCASGTGALVIDGATLSHANNTCCNILIYGVSSLTIHNATLGNGYFTYYLLSGYSLNSDYNTFQQSGASFYLNGTTYVGVAAYKAGTGQDAHSTP